MTRMTLALMALALTSSAHAKDYDMTQHDGLTKFAKDHAYEVQAKYNEDFQAPTSLAIAGFQVRFSWDGDDYNEYAMKDSLKRLSTEDYQMLTDRLYDLFVADLEARGFSVVDHEKVEAGHYYQKAKAAETVDGTQVMYKKERAVVAPSHMKNMGVQLDLGIKGDRVGLDVAADGIADATVISFVNFSLCEFKIKGQKGKQLAPCITMEAGEVAVGLGAKLTPAGWMRMSTAKTKRDKSGRAYGVDTGGKGVTNWTAAGNEGPLMYTGVEAMPVVSKNLWGTKRVPDQDAMLLAMATAYQAHLDVYWAAWDDAMAKYRKKVGEHAGARD